MIHRKLFHGKVKNGEILTLNGITAQDKKLFLHKVGLWQSHIQASPKVVA